MKLTQDSGGTPLSYVTEFYKEGLLVALYQAISVGAERDILARSQFDHEIIRHRARGANRWNHVDDQFLHTLDRFKLTLEQTRVGAHGYPEMLSGRRDIHRISLHSTDSELQTPRDADHRSEAIAMSANNRLFMPDGSIATDVEVLPPGILNWYGTYGYGPKNRERGLPDYMRFGLPDASGTHFYWSVDLLRMFEEEANRRAPIELNRDAPTFISQFVEEENEEGNED
ncbi:hypothetical protein EHF33_20550 (plasmid) [Deinococcus psychrotolerans]|uniref:Uncharacterized protein n=1 Tax=Deinococcus psychrotolerans TaxID=2489213 RepID=A0A3G8YJ81_9DEIO|nr:hypothetical protein [Deinococcus psychrotolerans]AZI45302.1 hypothetical protein EHF33_20550 [Deinococcus psychrotolerans]